MASEAQRKLEEILAILEKNPENKKPKSGKKTVSFKSILFK
jgi:hypothetical protein